MPLYGHPLCLLALGSTRNPEPRGLQGNGEGNLLLNLILSYDAPNATDQRAAMRSSWLSKPAAGYQFIFVIGGSPHRPHIRGLTGPSKGLTPGVRVNPNPSSSPG